MKTYGITMPVTGFIYREVKAESPNQALELFYSGVDLTKNDIEEWDIHEKIVEGNIFHGTINEMTVEEVQ